jgi:hypothetical protein
MELQMDRRTMTKHTTATREEWLATRVELPEAVKVLTPFPFLDRPG